MKRFPKGHLYAPAISVYQAYRKSCHADVTVTEASLGVGSSKDRKWFREIRLGEGGKGKGNGKSNYCGPSPSLRSRVEDDEGVGGWSEGQYRGLSTSLRFGRDDKVGWEKSKC
jgi:hypothetical protein